MNNSSADYNQLARNITANAVNRDQLTVWFAVMMAVAVFGVISNALLVAIISHSPKLRSGTGILILNLLLTCLAMCTLNYPVHVLLVYGHDAWLVPAKNACTFAHYFLVVTTYANNWAEACLGVNRFVATVLPHQYKLITKRKVCLGMVIFAWGISAVTMLPFCTNQVGNFPASNLVK